MDTELNTDMHARSSMAHCVTSNKCTDKQQVYRQAKQKAYLGHSGIDTGLHIDMHGPSRLQKPFCHPDQGAQHIWRWLGNHKYFARRVQPVQL